MSAVVVDLPLVPVMAMKGASGAIFARSRQNSSMSPITSTPLALASSTVQCGFGWVSGTPGASTSAAKRRQSASRRSSTAKPSRARLVELRRRIVPDDRLGAAGTQRPRRREARSAEPEHRERLAAHAR